MKTHRILLALALICAALPAWATDLLVTAPNIATLNAVAQQVNGLWAPDSKDANGNDVPAHIAPQGTGNALGGWAFVLFPNGGTWLAPTGATYTDQNGNPQPVMAPKDSNVYGLLRWNGDYTQIPFPAGTSVVTGTETINGQIVPTITITGPAGVTLTSPLPAGMPIAFE